MRGAAILVLALAATMAAQSLNPLQAREPVAEIVRLFTQYQVVLLGEVHGSIQLDELLKRLVRTPAFSASVNDIVVEMGNALHQDALDRYIAGGEVSDRELRDIWQDLVGTPGGTATPPYHGLFAAVREVNQSLPPERKIRVLAGDPPIDWSRVRGREDVAPFLPFRDEHYGSVVRYEVLAKRRKALLIMGAGHFQRREGKPGLIEQQILGSFAKSYVIVAGSDVVHSYDDVDARFASAAAGPWIMEMKGTWLGQLPRWSDSPTIGFPSAGASGAQVGTWEQTADAYLFLGVRDQLTTGGEQFDLEGTPYGTELRRRWTILFPNPPSSLPKDDGSIRPLLPRPAPPSPAR